MNIAVMGAGAVGAYFGGRFARAGHQVTLIARASHADAIAQRGGLLLDSSEFSGVIPLKAVSEPSGVQGADVILFCVKSSDTETAGAAMRPYLKPDASVICLQNGVDNAERLSAVIGHEAVPAAVYVAAEMAGPGHVKHHGRGELIIGPSPRSEAIAREFTKAGVPTSVSDTVIAVQWEKLVLNCAYNALSAVSQLSYRRLFEIKDTREVIRNTVDECMAVARALGIALPADMFERTLALATTIPNQLSSTAQDLARNKPTEIDFLNGYVVRKGRETSVPTPTNLALQVMVKLRELGQQ
ncbi:MAG TPA: 2-dehydropantoate 2-reductase [Afipia sp.]